MTFDSSIAYDKMLRYCNLFYQAVKKIDNQEIPVLSSGEIEELKADNDKRLLKMERRVY